MATTKRIAPAEGAYDYPLLIKRLLLSGVRYQPDQEIVYADKLRYSYRTLNERIQRLANALTAAGVKAGDTVALLDWDSHRALECFFAVPMLGAVLHTVNIRLSPEQVAYTMNHAEDDIVLVHDDFLPLMEQVNGELKTVRGYVQLTDSSAKPTRLPSLGEYEALLAGAASHFDFPDFDERSVATLFYTTGTTGNPKGVYFSHRQLVLHTMNELGTFAGWDGQPLLRSGDVYMPITPMFHVHAWGVPYVATAMGLKQVYPGRYEPNSLVRLFREEGVSFSHHPADDAGVRGGQAHRFYRLEDAARRQRPDPRPGPPGQRAGHARALRLRHVRDLPAADPDPPARRRPGPADGRTDPRADQDRRADSPGRPAHRRRQRPGRGP
jgi:fatty-acyl-CoA synthase